MRLMTALDHPWMRKTGFKPNDSVVGVIGHEWDFVHRESDVTGELTRFFHYEAGTSGLQIESDTDADAVSYQAPSNAVVFSTGTLGWTWRLDPDPRWDAINWPLNKIKEYKPQILKPDPRLQRFTRNMLDDLQKINPSVADNWHHNFRSVKMLGSVWSVGRLCARSAPDDPHLIHEYLSFRALLLSLCNSHRFERGRHGPER